MKIDILALDGVFDTGLAALLDTLATANELALAQGDRHAPFEVRLVGVRQRVRTAMGLLAQVQRAQASARPDWVVVPALNAKQAQSLVTALASREVGAAKTLLRSWQSAQVGIAAACVGTFVLAEAGLLDGRDATTSWPLAPLFRQRYPQVRLDDAHMVTACDGVVTAGAALGHLDLALWLVRQASPDLAAQVARFLLIDNRASQSRYIVPDHVAHADVLVARFERWARLHLAQGFSLAAAASALHVHPRTLQRRCETVLGKSPLAFFQDLRVERARQMVDRGCHIEEIATQVGYADAATLRNLLRRKLGRGVRALRGELRE